MIARATEIAATARPLQILRRPDIQARPVTVRDRLWWRLKDPVTLRFWQFGEEEYFLWSQLNEGTSLAELQRRFARRFAPLRIEIPHLHQFLGHLHREGLVFATAHGQAKPLLERDERQRTRNRVQAFTSLLAWRFRGVDPTPFLEWIYPRIAWLFSPRAIAVGVGLICSALLLLATQTDSLVRRLPQAAEFMTPENLVWLAATLAIVKIFHELGHALVCRHLGGRCHELGVMLLVLTPCLYCNVSDAWLLSSRWRRMAISAAGMGVELVLASAATWLWWFSEPGLFSTLCLNVMVVCSVSTLLFNGNPLLRYDGYFLLSDWLDLPNLRQASDEWLRNWVGRLLLGARMEEDQPATRDQRRLVATYALLSTTYRWFLTVVVWCFLYRWLAELGLAFLGLILIALSATAMVGQSTRAAIQFCSAAGKTRPIRPGRVALSLLVIATLLGLISLVPLPTSLLAPVVVRPANAANVYVTLPGTLVHTVRPGTRVAVGDALANLENEELSQDILRLTNERDGLKLHVTLLQRQQLHESRIGEGGAAGQLVTAEQQLIDASDRLARKVADQQQLVLTAPSAGVVLEPRARHSAVQRGELPQWQGTPLDSHNHGCFLETGTVLCQIGEPSSREAHLVIEQAGIDLVRLGQAVVVQLDELPQCNLHGTVRQIDELTAGGAPEELIAKRRLPSTSKAGEIELLGTYYQVIVALENGPAVPLGASGRAKIRVTNQTLAERAYRRLCETFRW